MDVEAAILRRNLREERLLTVAKLPGWQGVAAATPQKMFATPLATQVVRSVSNIHLLNGIIFFATEAVDLIGNLFKFKN